ncbi:hypothetical protein BGZ65_012007 [Modicella reniformis]|uniref:Uncharacterized protein n=1 Tax=Modicella reniformis TaxID=1440133 RepID=A0A9P6IP35_9FUNG|nr:hypothetical protein BGZ65_012007 [Modicella reniformis]
MDKDKKESSKKTYKEDSLKVKELEIKIDELETKLELAKQEAQDYANSLQEFKILHERLLAEKEENIKKDYQELYQHHIDSKNKGEFTKFAETEYKMVSRLKHNDIKSKLLETKKENKKLEEEKEQLQVNNAQLTSDVNVYQEKTNRAERKTSNFNNLCGSYVDDNAQVKRELEKERQKNTLLEKQIEDLQTQLTSQTNPEEIIHSDLDSDFDFNDLDSASEVDNDDNNSQINSPKDNQSISSEEQSNSALSPTSPQLTPAPENETADIAEEDLALAGNETEQEQIVEENSTDKLAEENQATLAQIETPLTANK